MESQGKLHIFGINSVKTDIENGTCLYGKDYIDYFKNINFTFNNYWNLCDMFCYAGMSKRLAKKYYEYFDKTGDNGKIKFTYFINNIRHLNNISFNIFANSKLQKFTGIA